MTSVAAEFGSSYRTANKTLIQEENQLQNSLFVSKRDIVHALVETLCLFLLLIRAYTCDFVSVYAGLPHYHP